MKLVFGICLLIIAQLSICECAVRHKRQSIANGEVITSIFQIPIQTLNAVHNLFQASRSRIQAITQAYQTAQQNHPNHKPNPHFYYNKGYYNSKALVQPNQDQKQKRRRYDDYY